MSPLAQTVENSVETLYRIEGPNAGAVEISSENHGYRTVTVIGDMGGERSSMIISTKRLLLLLKAAGVVK